MRQFRVDAIKVNTHEVYGGHSLTPLYSVGDVYVHGHSSQAMKIGEQQIESKSQEFRFSMDVLPDDLQQSVRDTLEQIELYLQQRNQ